MGRENSKIGEKERLKREKVMVAVLGIILATLEIYWLLWRYFLAQKMFDKRGLFDGNRFLKSD